jgi:hypothetical protein
MLACTKSQTGYFVLKSDYMLLKWLEKSWWKTFEMENAATLNVWWEKLTFFTKIRCWITV